MIISKNKIRTFFNLATLFTAAALLWIGITPSLTEDLVFLNFSLQRFILFCCVTVFLFFLVLSLFVIRNEKYYSFWVLLVKSKWVFLGVICLTLIAGAFVLGTPLRLFRENTFVLQRMLPITCLLLLISLDMLITQYLFSNGKLATEVIEMLVLIGGKIEKVSYCLNQKINYYLSTPFGSIVFLILVNSPILLINAARFDYPLGYSGLYTLMSDVLVKNNFRLPCHVPFYGPGGIPFAYPPLGFYIMGFFVGILGVPPLVYLRFLPALFYLSATLLFFLITKKLTKSVLAGIITSVIIAYSSINYEIHATSGGLTRGLALVFLLLCLLSYFNDSRRLIWKSILTSIFFALTLLTHLGYGFVLALALISITLSKPFSKKAWLLLLSVGILTLVFSAPWWMIMVSRYGFNVFTNAISSHGNGYLLQIISGEKPLRPWLKISFDIFNQNTFFGGVGLIGILYLFFTGNFWPALLFFLLMLFSEENSRYLIMLGATGIGVLLSKINSLAAMTKLKLHPFLRTILITFFIFLMIIPEATKILKMKPLITKEVFTLAEYLQPIKDKNSSYFFLENIDNQGEEWFPYVLSMSPFVGGWGGEWIFQPEETAFATQTWECISSKDYTCLINAIDEKSYKPDYLITFSTNKELNLMLIEDSQYFISYVNEKYTLWERKD